MPREPERQDDSKEHGQQRKAGQGRQQGQQAQGAGKGSQGEQPGRRGSQESQRGPQERSGTEGARMLGHRHGPEEDDEESVPRFENQEGREGSREPDRSRDTGRRGRDANP